MHRARSRTGTAVSVRTTHGRADYIYVGNRRWGGPVDHEEAAALLDQLGEAISVAEDPNTEGATRYFRARTPAGTSVSVRMNRPVLRQPEYTGGGIDYVRVGSGAWGGSITHEAAAALHACLRTALSA
jgi:hypothetical protein